VDAAVLNWLDAVCDLEQLARGGRICERPLFDKLHAAAFFLMRSAITILNESGG
jgi:hypothetical protein